MGLRIKIAARAAGQIQQAAHWWAANRPSAPNAIHTDFGEAVSLLAEQPGIGARYGRGKVSDIRRLFLNRVGYFVYYKVHGDSLHILAFWHARREHQPVF